MAWSVLDTPTAEGMLARATVGAHFSIEMETIYTKSESFHGDMAAPEPVIQEFTHQSHTTRTGSEASPDKKFIQSAVVVALFSNEDFGRQSSE
mmetsp:Transcript_26426/g.64393  ORF Transcript_26426/g.64393 Transcript_26426/m.64393 type:complete len:93 (+) Transcript_26426:818-1096(+)